MPVHNRRFQPSATNEQIMTVSRPKEFRIRFGVALAAAGSILALQQASARPIGVDVSSYQGTPNWASAKSCGWTFAFAKATEGATINDPDYRYNINNAKANGVYVGAYHFAHPNLNSPGTESSHFWGVISGDVSTDGKSMQPVLDFEVFSGVTGASSYTAWADAFNNNIVANAKAKGVTVKPVLYTSACSACNFGSAIGSWIPWIANYNGQSSQSGTPWSVCGSCDIWNKWTLWQYSSSGSVCGISGGCDVDVFNGTSSSLVSTMVIDGNGASALGAAPAAVSWGSGRLDVIVRGGGDAIYHKYYVSGTGWLPNGPTGGFERLGGVAEYGPGLASWAPNRLDAFCIATDDSLQHKYYDGGGNWLPDPHWEDLGGTASSAPSAVSWGSGRIDVVVRGGQNHIYHKYYISGQGWLPNGSFNDIGGNATTSPAICSMGSGSLDVFYRGTDNALKHLYYRSGAWNGPEDLGGTLSSGPTAVARSGRIDVFVRGGQNHIYHKYYITGTGWSGFGDIGGNATSPPGACSMAADSYDVFYRGTDNNLKHLYWRGSGWLGPEDLGGTLQ